jgi:gliding motility-associated-like protein
LLGFQFLPSYISFRIADDWPHHIQSYNMKHNCTLARTFFVLCLLLSSYVKVIAQSHEGHDHSHGVTHANDSLSGFNEPMVRQHAQQKGLSAYEIEKFVERAKKDYILRVYYPGAYRSRQQQIAEGQTANANRFTPASSTAMAPCTNMDFETGNFTGWTGSTGDNTSSSSGPLQNIVPGLQSNGMDALLSDQLARHTIVSAASGNDPCGGFPMVAPGGNYSVRLGGTTANYQGEILEQTFTVAPGNTSFTYQYAVVLNDGGHSAGEQPYFKIEMFDQSGNLVPCSQYYVEASGSIPGFQACVAGSTYYKPWTTVNIDLSSFVTANVTIRFTVAGCIFAGHYGYAYVDCSCLPYALALSDSLCAGNSVTINAPPGAASYNWTLGAPPGASLSTADSLVVNMPGNYYVEMVSVTGCTTYLNVNIGLYPQPTAAFTPSFPPCSPNYTFTNNSSVSSGTMTYFWDFGDPALLGDTSIVTSPTYVYTPPGPYTVWLYVVTQGGCRDSVSHVVNPGNGGLAGFTQNDVCLGSPMIFTDTTINPSTWSWYFGDPNVTNDSSNVQNPTYTYPAPGSYTVTLTAGTTPCPSTFTTVVTVHGLPTSSYVYNQICGGQTVNFTATSTINVGDTIATYAWNFGDPGSGGNNTSTLSNPSHTFSTSGTFTVTLITTSTFGCTNTSTQVLTVGPTPVAAFSATTVCTNSPMLFTNNSQNSANWFWNFGDPLATNDTSLLQNPTYTYTTPGTYTVTLTAEPASNCYDTAQLIVTVAPGPVAAFAAPAVCEGTSTTFFDQSAISSGSITDWSWDFGTSASGDTSNLQNPGFTYPVAGTYTVTLTITSNNGCTTTLTQPVTINANPTANFSANTVCIGSPTQFTDLSIAGSGNLTVWGWDYGDGSPFGAGQNPTHTYTNDSTYNVTLVVQNSNGCLDTILLTAVTAPQPVVVFTADTFQGCPPLCVNFQDQTAIASGSITGWTWDFGDGSPQSFTQNPSHCYPITGVYTVTLTTTSNNGCVQTLVFPNMITVYPEPLAAFSASPMVTTVSQTHVEFTDLSQGSPVSWFWDFGDGATLNDTSNTQHTSYDYTQEYGSNYTVHLEVANVYGCTDDTSLEIIVQPEFTFYIPNAFTPNGDGINDVFFGTGIGIAKYEMWIFDRWGNLIFTCTDLNQTWDGTVQGASGDLCQIDTYVWKVAITDVFDKRHKYIGHVSLIR